MILYLIIATVVAVAAYGFGYAVGTKITATVILQNMLNNGMTKDQIKMVTLRHK